MPWFVLKTKPNCEKKAADKLQAINVNAYCPVKTVVKQWSDRKKKVQVPLLPSMILVNCNEADRNMVFGIPYVRPYLFWLGKPAVVTEKEVEALRLFETEDYKRCDLETIKVGETVDLSSIGLQQQKGVVKYVSGDQCWVVLDSLGYIVKLQLAK
ncbi:UpxY family transcription antiterminator [Xanthomarina sp. F1114]|uniref:UpxY family transcription antiterminator n=1 Tax=Xanthomarina sp. F1114 TaxID=2996019 RepID=UPI00225DE460|nr:UpxY family transcription antiterminator [Xanthomarina sp. F1114]MCX7548853.1 UpxY family transcription antiterminator [Xanthomarina sp. F1114]